VTRTIGQQRGWQTANPKRSVTLIPLFSGEESGKRKRKDEAFDVPFAGLPLRRTGIVHILVIGSLRFYLWPEGQ